MTQNFDSLTFNALISVCISKKIHEIKDHVLKIIDIDVSHLDQQANDNVHLQFMIILNKRFLDYIGVPLFQRLPYIVVFLTFLFNFFVFFNSVSIFRTSLDFLFDIFKFLQFFLYFFQVY